MSQVYMNIKRKTKKDKDEVQARTGSEYTIKGLEIW